MNMRTWWQAAQRASVLLVLSLSPVGSYAQTPAPPLITAAIAVNRTVEPARKLTWPLAYEDLKQTDFFSFFRLHEVGTPTTAMGMTRITLETGGFQDEIDLALTLDAERRVIAAELRLARSWIGDTRSVSTFATDIAASFMRTFASAVDRPQAKLFSDGLLNLHGTEDQVIRLGRQPARTPPPPPPDVLELLHTVTGSAQRFEAELQSAQITAFNTDSPARAQWVLTMLAKARPGAARAQAANASRPAKVGGTLLAQADAMFAFTGQRPKIVLNERYAALEPKVVGHAVDAAELVRVIQLAVHVSNVDRTDVSIVVYDGRTEHSINVTGTSTDLSTITYFDPLGSGSFLQKPNNVAGVDATPAPGRPRHWNVATSQLERVLYGAILYPQVVESMNQAASMLRDLSAGIPKALEQKSKSPQAPLAQAATWERLATMLQRQGSAAWAASARRLEAALRN